MHDASTTMAPPRAADRPRRGELLLAGGGAGLVGGVVMMLWMILAALVDDRSALSALRPIGLTFLGESAVEGTPLVTAWGIFLQLAVAAALGVPLAAMLASRADAAMVVVRADHTSRAKASATVAMLRQTPAVVLGALFNGGDGSRARALSSERSTRNSEAGIR